MAINYNTVSIKMFVVYLKIKKRSSLILVMPKAKQSLNAMRMFNNQR
jgi:hypothetical protein